MMIWWNWRIQHHYRCSSIIKKNGGSKINISPNRWWKNTDQNHTSADWWWKIADRCMKMSGSRTNTSVVDGDNWWTRNLSMIKTGRTKNQYISCSSILKIDEPIANRNVRRDVTALTGWQRSHHWHPVMTRQKRCFYKGQSLTWARIFVVN